METKGKMPPANRALVAQGVCPVSSRVGIIYVRDATLSVATVGAISDMMVAGLAEDSAIETASSMAAPVGPISLGGRGGGGRENGVDVCNVLQLRLQGLMGHGCHLKACRRGPDFQDGSVFLGA